MDDSARKSAEDALEKIEMNMDTAFVSEAVKDRWIHDLWKVTFSDSKGCGFSSEYRTGTAVCRIKKTGWDGKVIGHKLKHPGKKSIVYSLVLDSSALSQCFEDWCEEFGYNQDSRNAFQTYQKCVETSLQFRRWLGSFSINLGLLQEYFAEYPM